MRLSLPIIENLKATLINWSTVLQKSLFIGEEDFVWTDYPAVIKVPYGGTTTLSSPIIEEAKYIKIGQICLTLFKCSFRTNTIATNNIDLSLPFTHRGGSDLRVPLIARVGVATYEAIQGRIFEGGDVINLTKLTGNYTLATEIRVSGSFFYECRV